MENLREWGTAQQLEVSDRAFSQLLLDALPSAALVLDPFGKIVGVNLEAEMLLGWPAPALLGRVAHEMLECRAEATADGSEDCPVASALKAGSVLPSGQLLLRCADDSFRAVEYRCVPHPTTAGVGAVLAFRDLTREIEMEKDLSRLAAVAEESPIAIVELNEDANLLYANPAMMSLIERFGFSSEARPVILPANITKLTLDCLQTKKEITGIEVSVGGIHYEWKLCPIAPEKLVRGYGMDLTARKRAEFELTQAKAKAEVASHAKSKFLANISDEIRTPIAEISHQADLLLQSGVNAQQFEYAKAIAASSKPLMAAIDDILAMAALETGIVSFETAPFNFRAFMTKTLAAFIQRAEKRRVQFSVIIGNQIPSQVCCDATRLGQLLHGLLSDALKRSECGEVVVEVDRDTISSVAPVNGDGTFYLFFTIAERSAPNADRANSAGHLSEDGCADSRIEEPAFGLTLAEQLVEVMGGKVEIGIGRQSGSQFCFRLPMHQIRRRSPSSESSPQSAVFPD